jgi:predicted ABC-type transport system involved in lysophospholipase L1 biosynthesis ATPase subunit
MVDLSGRGDGKALIVVGNLDKTYIRGSEVIHVLQGLNLDVDKGEFVAFMGPSGSGKARVRRHAGPRPGLQGDPRVVGIPAKCHCASGRSHLRAG